VSAVRYPQCWIIGDWAFYRVEGHGFTHVPEDRSLYGFGPAGDEENGNDPDPGLGELYNSLEHAMAAAIAEKFTGKRGAGGTGVGTAADWFMKMVGAHDLNAVAAPHWELEKALEATKVSDPRFRRAREMADHLDRNGLTVARLVNRG
jgi:hypothetical protein